MSKSKLFVLLVVAGVLALAPYGQAAAPNLVQNPRFITAASDPAVYAAENWAYLNTAITIGTTGQTAIVTQVSGGGLKMESVSYEAALGDTADRGVWQAVPVVAGATYQVDASWKGRFLTDGTTTTTSRTSCNMYVAFGTSATGPWSGELQLSYKRLAWNRVIDSWNVPASLFFPANVASYDWSGSWESARNSPATNQSVHGDVPVVVPAGMTYMRIRFAFSADDQPASSGGSAYVVLDNVTITGCQGALAGDTNSDCDVDKFDLANVVNTWLACGNSAGSSLCW